MSTTRPPRHPCTHSLACQTFLRLIASSASARSNAQGTKSWISSFPIVACGVRNVFTQTSIVYVAYLNHISFKLGFQSCLVCDKSHAGDSALLRWGVRWHCRPWYYILSRLDHLLRQLRRSVLDGIARNYSTLRQTRPKRRQDKQGLPAKRIRRVWSAVRRSENLRSRCYLRGRLPIAQRKRKQSKAPSMRTRYWVLVPPAIFLLRLNYCVTKSVRSCAIDFAVVLEVEPPSGTLFTCLAAYRNQIF